MQLRTPEEFPSLQRPIHGHGHGRGAVVPGLGAGTDAPDTLPNALAASPADPDVCVDPGSLYLDPQGAAAYLAMVQDPAYAVRLRNTRPLGKLAQIIARETQRAGLEIVALGPGDAREEVHLLRSLISLGKRPDYRLFLLELSQPLLGVAFRHVADALHDQAGVSYFAMQGDFRDLPRYPQLCYTPAQSRRRRLVCMFGYTVGSLDDELAFFRRSLAKLTSGDLLALDLQLCAAPADQPDEIRRKEPDLRGPVSSREALWLTGPLRRRLQGQGVRDVRLTRALRPGGQVPGSYTIETVAQVEVQGGGAADPRQLVVRRDRRYDPALLSGALATLGWEPLCTLRYGPAGSDPVAAVLLLRRMPTAAADWSQGAPARAAQKNS